MISIDSSRLIRQSRHFLTLITVVTICGFLLTLSFPAMAKSSKPQKPSITTVIVDTDAGELQIFGSDFSNPKVILGAMALNPPHLRSENGELIVAIPAIDPGDYRLILIQGKGAKNRISYDLTVGGSGTTGPTGATGSEGPMGPAGGTTNRIVLESAISLPDAAFSSQVVTASCNASYPRIVFCGHAKGDLNAGIPDVDGVKPVLGNPDSCEYMVYGNSSNTLNTHLLCSE